MVRWIIDEIKGWRIYIRNYRSGKTTKIFCYIYNLGVVYKTTYMLTEFQKLDYLKKGGDLDG